MKEQFEIKFERNDFGIEVSRPTKVGKHLYKFYIHHPGHEYLDLSFRVGMWNYLSFLVYDVEELGEHTVKVFTGDEHTSRFSLTGLPKRSDVIMHYEGVRYSTCVYLILDDATDVRSAKWIEN